MQQTMCIVKQLRLQVQVIMATLDAERYLAAKD
jgi:hypothetical protein